MGSEMCIRDRVKAAKASVREMGFGVKPAIAKGWIDAAIFANWAGIPTVGLGPTTKGQAHVVDEYEEVECLHLGAQAVLNAALNFLGEAPGEA